MRACLNLTVAAMVGTVLFVSASDARAAFPGSWGGGGEGYELSADSDVKHGGAASGAIRSTDDAKRFGTFTQAVQADKYRGKRVRLRGFIKSEGVEGSSGLWMRVDGKDKVGVAFDNMMNRPVEGTTDWKQYEVVLDVPDDAHGLFFGCLLVGKGKVWVDDLAIETVGDDVPVTDLKPQVQDRTGEPPANLPAEPGNLDFES
jgi:hypothetical protein